MRIQLGVDAGNHSCKVAGAYGVLIGRSAICDWFQRDFDEDYGKGDDFEFEINGRKGFMGTLASYEDQFGGGSLFGDNKANDETQIRVLLTIYRYMREYCPSASKVSLVTGQPVKSHNDTEKQKIIAMLEGEHDFIVNGEQVKFTIEEVAVVAEGSGAYWSQPQKGTVRILDVGSGTVNAVTVIDNRQNNNGSDTFNFGMETVTKTTGLGTVANGINRSAAELRWKSTDNVVVCGWAANELLPYIQKFFVNAETVSPMLQYNDGMKILAPVYANAIGFYEMARMAFGND